MSRKAEILVSVDLDGDKLPTKIEWQATEGGHDEPLPCQAFMLAVWDADRQETAAIDLWTKDTTIDDMNRHFYQVFHKMADTYLRATNNPEVAQLIHEFGDGFGRTLGLR